MRFVYRPNTLSGQLNLYLGVGLGVFALLAGALIYQLVSHTLDQTLRDKAQALSQQLALVTLDSVLMRDYAVIERYADDLVKQGQGITYLKIVTDQQEVLAQFGIPPDQQTQSVIQQTTPILFLDRTIGQIELNYSRSLVNQTFRHLMLLGLLGLVVILGLQSWLIKQTLNRRFIRPIEQLLGSLDLRKPPQEVKAIDPYAPAEVKQLERHINQLHLAIQQHIAELEKAHQFTTQASERLRDGQRLAAIGQMAAGLAHNLNTPLANIIGYAQMNYQSSPEPAFQKRMLVIERQAKQCSDVVKSLLNASRRPDTFLSPLEIQPFLKSFCNLVRPVLEQKGLKKLVLKSEPSIIEVDASLLEQVLFNLLDNAVDAQANEIIIELNPEHKTLDIIDNGEGINPNLQTQVFEAFMTTKPIQKGTGLGLFLSQQMLQSMQASLTLINSQPGHTHFRIQLSKAVNHEQ